jgi:5-methylcytosine-specific restriction enzyme A
MRDEVILALDLYVREDRNPGMAACAEVSSILRAIPIEMEKSADPSFRGPDSVRSKTQNFLGLDPNTTKVGRTNSSRMDRKVWEEFSGSPTRLRTVAEAIGANVSSLSPTEAVVDDEEIVEAPEGTILTRIHKKRERSRKLREAKKKRVLSETGRLACEACDLDFGERYGDWGEGFIECHHLIPVSSLRPGERTKVDDLALLCSNCHRMVHLRRPWLTLEKLIEIQSSSGAPTTAEAQAHASAVAARWA